MSSFARYDGFIKAQSELNKKTLCGGCVTIMTALWMVWLLCAEFSEYNIVRTENHLFVDDTSKPEDVEVPIELEVDLLAVKCEDADLKEQMHDKIFDVTNLEKKPSDDGQGCKLIANFTVDKTDGSFFISTESHLNSIGQNIIFRFLGIGAHMNSTHIVRHLSFGPKMEGIKNPLDGNIITVNKDEMAQIKYTLKLVPTTFHRIDGAAETSYQYSVTEYRRHSDFSTGTFVRPGIYFKYSFSPLRLEKVDTRAPFLTFITSLCAILGGVFSCCGMLDACTEKTAAELKKLA